MKKLWEKFINLRIWSVLGGVFRKIGAFFAKMGRAVGSFFVSAGKLIGAIFVFIAVAIAAGVSLLVQFIARHSRAAIAVGVILFLALGTFLTLFLTLPVKSVEVEGEVILLEGEAYSGGLNIKATTKAGLIHREEVLSSMISGLDSATPGEQTVTVSYKKWQVPVTVKVLALSEVTLCVRAGTMPDVFEPNDPFPTSGVFDLYYNGELIRSAPITRDQVPGFTTKLSRDYDTTLVYRNGLSLPYHYTVLEVIESITPTGVLYAPQGVALSKNNAVGNLRFLVKYKDGTEEYVMIYDERIFVQDNLLAESEKDYKDVVTFVYKGVEVQSEVTAYHGDLLAPKFVTLNLGRTVYKQGESFDYSATYVSVIYERFGDTPVLLRATQDMILLAELQGDPSAENLYVVPITDGTAPITFDEVKYYTLVAYYNLAQSSPVTVRVVSEEDSVRVTGLSTTWRGRKSGPPLKGQDLEFEDAELTVEYGFGYRYETVPLTAEMVVGYDKSTAGDQTLTISYQAGEDPPFLKEINVRVGDPDSDEVTAILMLVAWNEPTLHSSDELVVPETAYLEVEIGYGGRENRRVYLKDNADVTITGFTPHTAEEQTLTISYAGLEIAQPFAVRDDRTEKIEDFWAPESIEINVGEDLDLSGECTVFYSTKGPVTLSLKEVLDAGGQIVGHYNTEAVGSYRVWIYYPGFEHTDHSTWIYVIGEESVTLKGIRLDVLNAKTDYLIGETLDLGGMEAFSILFFKPLL